MDEKKKEETTEQKNANENDVRKEESGPLQKESARKFVCCLAYVYGLFFFLPWIFYPNDGMAKKSANEGLALLLISAVTNVVFGILISLGGVFGTIFGILLSLADLCLLILGILGIVYVLTDKNEPLPLIGSFRILK